MAASTPNPLKKNIFEKIYETISKPFSISGEKNTLNLKKYLAQRLSGEEALSASSNRSKSKSHSRASVTRSFAGEMRDRQLSLSEVYEEREKETKSDGRRSMDKSFGSSISESPNEAALNAEELMTEFLGPRSEDFIQEVR